MHVTITKCLDYGFSVDVAASMLVDKRKSVPLRFGKIFLANFAKKKKTNKNKQTKKTLYCCVDVSTNNLQQGCLVISQPPSGH